MIKALLLAMPDIVPQFNLATVVPNLGIASIAGNVDPSICDIKAADLVLVKNDLKHYIHNILHKHSPALVGLSCMSFQYHSAVRIAKWIKSYNKDILIAIGGYHPTLMYDEISASTESEFIDFIIRGEGEATFNELAMAINAGSGYDGIKGLSYKIEGTFYHNSPRNLLPLDVINLPKRDARLINKGFHTLGLPSDVLETSRGCTHGCKFCCIGQMYGRNFRKYEVSRVISDIKDAYKHGARSLIFADDNIALDIPRLELLCEEIISSKLNSIHYTVQISVNSIANNEKLVKKMADAGVKLVFLGIENSSIENMNFLGKRTIDQDNTRKVVRYLRDNGIISFGGFIVGNPNDNEESLWNICRYALDMHIDIPIFSILIPHAKTAIREELMAENLVTNVNDYSTYHSFSANVRTRYLTSRDIERIVVDMYAAYQENLDYIKFNQVRKIYPLYFWKLVLKNIPSAIFSLTKRNKRTKSIK